MPRGRLIAFNALCVIAAAALVAGCGFGTVPGPPMVVLLTLLVVAAELWVVRLAVFGQKWTISMVEAVLAATLYHHGGAWVALAGAAGMGLTQVLRQQPAVKAVTNTTMYAACFAAGGAVSTAVPLPPLGQAAAGTLTFWALNLVLLSTVMGWATGRGTVAVLGDNAPVSFAHVTANLSMGLLAGWVAAETQWALAAFVVPALVIFACYRALTWKVDQTRLLSEMITGQQQVRGRSIEDSAQALMFTVAGTFGTADVEMVVMDGEGPRRYDFRSNAPTLVDAGPDAAAVPWLPQLFGADRVTHGRTANAAWVALQIGQFPGPVIALRASGTARRASRLTRRDTRLARALVEQADRWFDAVPAGPTSCDLSERLSRTAGSPHHTLRDAAARLITLSEVAPGALPVPDVLRELHRLERAVAVLLGSPGVENTHPGTVPDVEVWVDTGAPARVEEPHLS